MNTLLEASHSGRIAVGCAGIFATLIDGVISNVIHASLVGKLSLLTILWVMFLKPVITAVTALPVTEGSLAPSLVNRAMLGMLVGLIGNWFDPDFFPGEANLRWPGMTLCFAQCTHNRYPDRL